MSNTKQNSARDFIDCNDATTIRNAYSAHSIDPQSHDNMVARFSLGANPAPVSFYLDDAKIDYTKDCNSYGLRFSFDYKHLGNDDISIATTQYTDLPVTNFCIMYSFPLLKGMKNNGIIKFECRKAIAINSGIGATYITIALRGLDINDRVVTHFDLTGQIPIIIE